MLRLTPLASAIAMLALAGGLAGLPLATAQAGSAGAAWMASGGSNAQLRVARPNVVPGGLTSRQQQQQARTALSRSVTNLNRTANAIAAQQALQAAARQRAGADDVSAPDGLTSGGLVVDGAPLTAGWTHAKAPVQGQADGRTEVRIEQTADKAILNWETFNVGKNTTVKFQQDANWAVLNRVNDPQARPSQIQGRIEAPGTVMIVNANGVVFSGSSQVNVRNLVAAAASITDAQFTANGLYVDANGSAPTFTDALGDIAVLAGARISTQDPSSSTVDGGYVMLLGANVANAGEITTPRGQAVLAAGDSFIIRKGRGTESNSSSTTAGNEVTTTRVEGSVAGQVRNTGLLGAATGDITLTGHEVMQAGVAVATTSTSKRGTIHLSSRASDDTGTVTFGAGATTAILLADTDAIALDSQRDSLLATLGLVGTNNATGAYDNLSTVTDRADLSRIEVVSGSTVEFQGDSMTLATGGEIVVSAVHRALVDDGATLDVSGAVGVNVAMAANNISVNVQGNELRDASVNRDSDEENGRSHISSTDVWIDQRSLIYVPAGTNGYESDRWYTAGGLLEVSGYLANQGHTAGEWLASGGTITVTGGDLVTRSNSSINLSGGTLDVQSGMIRQSWLKGADGRLYEVSSAPADMLYTGLYRGYERSSARWGATELFYNPLIAPSSRMAGGYTVGRDAGKLVVATESAVLDGQLIGEVYQGDRQTEARVSGLDGYQQRQNAQAQGAQLVIGLQQLGYIEATKGIAQSLQPMMAQVTLRGGASGASAMVGLQAPLDEARRGQLVLDSDLLNGFSLGSLTIAASESIQVDEALVMADGGELTLYGPQVQVNAGVTAHGGQIRLGDVLQLRQLQDLQDIVLDTPDGLNAQVVVADGVRLDVSGVRSDVRGNTTLAWRNGGSLALRSSGDVLLGDGSVLDVSGGVTRDHDGQLQGGNGGSITLHASEQRSSGGARLRLDGELRGYGSATAGTLSLRAALVHIGGQDDGSGALHLNEDFFSSGFSQYKVRGVDGLVVAEGSQVDVTRPVQWLDSSQPAGIEAQGWLPPLTQENAVDGKIVRRGGAGLSLAAGDATFDQAAREQAVLLVGRGAAIRVDPRQTIALSSTAQLTMDGTLQAAGGTVSLLQELPLAVQVGIAEAPHQRAIRLGSEALIDVSGQAYTAVDALGRRYGQVDDAGRIVVGGSIDHAAGVSDGAYLYVDLAEGARLRADGTSAVIDVPGMGAVDVASNGGSISLASSLGLRVDGSLSARAGGAGAAGGSLEVALDTGLYRKGVVDDALMVPRELVLRQGKAQGNGRLDYARGYLDVGQLEAGGFGNLALLSDGSVAFDGSLVLDMAQSLKIYAGSLVLAESSADDANVTLRAPYVRLAGSNHDSTDVAIRPTVKGGLSQQLSQARLQVEAQLLELRDSLTLGARGSLALSNGQSLDFDRRGFALTRLRSEGDLRFLAAVAVGNTVLQGNADLELLAAQLYPTSGAVAQVITGQDAVLRIGRVGAALPAVPHSVFGSLSFVAGTVEQGGVLRAPLGGISLGENSDSVHKVRLLPGSITSVSAKNLLMPYGGTVDGLSYLYDGEAVALIGAAGGLGVTLAGQSVDVQEGALIDLSGGGELTGAGFVSGRGGSTDARYYPLVQLGSDGQLLLPSLSSNPVYAIVPGLTADYAPLAGEAGVANPAVGQQITIDHGVPGLAAGTYTLLPASYALLPGAFRVELNGLSGGGPLSSSLAMRNGSWTTSGRLSVAHTSISQALPGQFIVTSGDVLRRYSQYNEMSYADFVRADAATKGVPRASLEADGKLLHLLLRSSTNADETLSFAGMTDFSAAAEGRAGSASLRGSIEGIEILADGQGSKLEGVEAVVSVRASQINALGAPSLTIGGKQYVQYGQGGNQITFQDYNRNVWLRSGAELRGAELLLLSSNALGGVHVEQGASITTVGYGDVPFDANDGFVVTPGARALLAVSNGRLDVLAPDVGSGNDAPGKILIGECSVSPCSGQTQLYTEGSIVAATNNTFSLDDAVSFGARYLGLSVGRINVGSSEALASAAAAGVLGQGLTFNQEVMNRLFQGVSGSGVPALETLTLAAADSLNFFGDVVLDTYDAETGKNRLEQLVLGVPAIYGLGEAGDRALVRTGELVWNGATHLPGAPIAHGAGSGDGVLEFQVESMVFGYGAAAQPDSTSGMARQSLGFRQVSIKASQQVSANNKGSLEVYHRRGDYQADGSLAYTGGDLVVDTPVWTGNAGSINHIKVGGELRLTGGGGQRLEGREGLGAELTLSGQRLDINGSFSLPSGKLSLEAVDELLLGENSQIDLAGRSLAFNDVLKYSAGGTLVLASQAGSILQAAGSLIDLSAINHRAGRLEASALGEQAGRVALLGTILGAASGQYDAGGTLVSYAKGVADIRARQLDDFAALNERLNRDEMTGGRSFQLKQGDLVVGNELKANDISISLDNGHLTINGVIDASGDQVGSIRLAAKQGLTIASGALLDAHGSQLRVDSYGAIIDAPNRAVIDLDSGSGQLTLQARARFDLRHGTDAVVGAGAGQHDGRERGTLQLTAPRVGGEIAGDIAIDASGALDIRGARSIAVVGSQRYSDAKDGGEAANGRDYQYIDQDYLDAKHGLNQKFMEALLANADLLDNRLKGLRGGSYADALHLRPGIEVTTAAGVDLVVRGDLDLSGHRYESLNLNTPLLADLAGSGEVGNLSLRAGGNLEVYGSISDGFAEPDLATDGNRWDGRGWILTPGKQPFDSIIVIPRSGVELAAGTLFPEGSTLNFDLPFSATTLAANTRLPGEMVLSAALTVPAGTVLDAAILDGAGNVLHAAGSLLGSAVSLPAGTRLAAGSRLPVALPVRDGVWASGAVLPNGGLSQRGMLGLASGAVLPQGVDIKLAADTPYIDLRPEVNGQHGRNWALARMLPEGSQSWSMRLVAGADLEAADSRLTSLDTTAGMLRLADQHYTAIRSMETVPAVIKYVWSDLATGSRVPGAAVPDNQASVCRLRPTWCVISEQIPGYTKFALNPQTQLFSVLRTGTGDLELLSAGDWRMDSLYGVYTAGTQSAAVMADGVDPYQLAQGRLSDGTVLGSEGSAYESATDGYRAWYPEHGGNLLLAAGGNLSGNLVGAHSSALATPKQPSSAAVGNWLWRQGDAGTPAAWWLNFGSYALESAAGGGQPWLVGFTGIGTLGGGNLDVFVKGAAGLIETAASNLLPIQAQRSQGLNLAVASTGRVLADGSVRQTGGGDLDLRVGGGINTSLEAVNTASLNPDLRGVLTNLRGALLVEAASIGMLDLTYGSYAAYQSGAESRAYDPYVATRGAALGGVSLMPGDGAVRVTTRGDLVVQGVGDAGRVSMFNATPFAGNDGVDYQGNGWSWFSLWRANTAVDLFSLGGHLTPIAGSDLNTGKNLPAMGGRLFYPTALRAVAANGSLYYGEASKSTVQQASAYSLMTAPSVNTELQLLAGQSIYAGGYTVSQTGTDASAIATPQHPAYLNYSPDYRDRGNNLHADLPATQWAAPLFSFAVNSYIASVVQPTQPVRFYALEGDIVGLSTGEIVRYPNDAFTLYQGAGPVWIMAGRDIVNAGVPLGAVRYGAGGEINARYGQGYYAASTGNLFIHGSSTDVSIVRAGRDIRLSSFNVAGPGLLEVIAGRSVLASGQGVGSAYQEGAIRSIGSIGGGGGGNDGASISVIAGAGAAGPDYAGLLSRYLDSSRLLAAGEALDANPDKVVKVYDDALLAWLEERFGFVGDKAAALAFFETLPGEQQRIFARQIYFAELRAGGREYNDAGSPRQGSYLRGREVIAALFPEQDEAGSAISYAGNATFYGGAGIHTDFGGDIQVLTPGGEQVFGVAGEAPPSTAGVITRGSGDIQLYSRGSILLGQSRIMTTFGGAILGWSAQGDINAGRGSRTTVVYTPPRRTYDNVGNVAVAPDVPASGAGIATLAPIPEVPAGDVDLIAPLGTVDAGEAGIRVSGNVNVAALRVVNADNIQAQGESTGVPVAAAVNVGALSNASAASSAAAATAQETVARSRAAARQNLPSIINVQILGFGGDVPVESAVPVAAAAVGRAAVPGYDAESAVQILGAGRLDAQAAQALTPQERKALHM